ncbi:hypothetical protein BCV70DRAFT_222203 [Testicularia cyperi]|uniref:Uncharacterized protein n=1 Tax=Testicularia cyperi TaxID=1882483 RepID=A0A317XI90_9BASI|nr:hypothetical protein BCV70DRAFT_222203 [Testicularia cyperi]
MHAQFWLVAASALLASQALADGLIINTPSSLTQCQAALITWSGAQGKTYVTVLPGGQPSAEPLVSFDVQDANSSGIKWIPNLPEGTSVTLAISDDTGVKNYSNTAVVRKGPDQSCIKDGQPAAAPGSTSAQGSSSDATSTQGDGGDDQESGTGTAAAPASSVSSPAGAAGAGTAAGAAGAGAAAGAAGAAGAGAAGAGTGTGAGTGATGASGSTTNPTGSGNNSSTTGATGSTTNSTSAGNNTTTTGTSHNGTDAYFHLYELCR